MSQYTCPVYEAAKNGHEDALQLLIEHGANVNLTIHLYCGNIVSPLFRALEEYRYDAIRLLISYGATMNYCSNPDLSIIERFVHDHKDDVLSMVLGRTGHTEYSLRKIDRLLNISVQLGYGKIARLLLDWIIEGRVDSIIMTANKYGHEGFEEEFRGI